ncbi:MAG: 2Fe-2S iron-sulfur cluster binding domain-containing protein [Flavobacteriales bacterium]|nr:2Fe-2S iron-sulfur cluster binding domain-containing protein [Flavobacteriales bacterium]MCB9335275.1 2Fe-2S iron-sulfur cluster binding domain-containing protein [Flavobacteriales bacterium]
MSLFKKVIVKDVRRETPESVSVAFDVNLNDFPYHSGQYITIKKEINGEDVRRSYSLSSAPYESDFRIAVKQIKNGKMSTFFNEALLPGVELEIMLPQGNFYLDPENDKHYVGFAAGSGITPVISMIKQVLNVTNSKFTLYYGNKNENLTIFKKELDELLTEFGDRLNVHYVFSQQANNNKLFEGRINEKKFDDIIRENVELLQADGFFLCGPEEMINAVSKGLEYLGVGRTKIHFELFTVPVKASEPQKIVDSDFKGTSHLTVIMDGEEIEFDLDSEGDFILDAAINNGVDAPFSCKGAVCCTCKAQVVEGKAIMDMNYSLSDAEVEEGFILTCQAHPASEKVMVDFDVV